MLGRVVTIPAYRAVLLGEGSQVLDRLPELTAALGQGFSAERALALLLVARRWGWGVHRNPGRGRRTGRRGGSQPRSDVQDH
jgi:hypothetical protein